MESQRRIVVNDPPLVDFPDEVLDRTVIGEFVVGFDGGAEMIGHALRTQVELCSTVLAVSKVERTEPRHRTNQAPTPCLPAQQVRKRKRLPVGLSIRQPPCSYEQNTLIVGDESSFRNHWPKPHELSLKPSSLLPLIQSIRELFYKPVGV